MNTIDFTGRYDLVGANFLTKILTVDLTLSRNEMCEALKYDYILLNGDYYNTPVNSLVDNIINKKYDSLQTYELIQYQDEK